MSRRALWLAAAIALSIFVAVTVAVTAGGPIALDADAFDLARDVRSPTLDDAARIVTTFGLLAVVGPAVAVAAVVLIRAGHVARAVALATGAALTWAAVWVVKRLVGRPRPPHPLVHTAGQSYPSAHAANSVGWVALALALGVVIGSRAGRVAVVVGATVLAALVGLSRIYLRAHYLTDVLGGESLAVTVYALAAVCVALGRGGGRGAVAPATAAPPAESGARTHEGDVPDR